MAHRYENIYEAPETWRHVGHVPIGVEQLNTMLERAEQLGAPGAPDYGKAKQEFRDANEIEDGQWVPRKAKARGKKAERK